MSKPTTTRPGGPPAKKPGGQPGARPGAAGRTLGAQDPAELEEDNPGNVHGIGVDDHVFFHREDGNPHAGKVLAHGHHGCQVEDDAGARHKVHWNRVLGLKKRSVREAKVIDRGEAGSIVEHPDGRRVFVAGDLGLPDDPSRLDLEALEARAGAGPKDKPLERLESTARSSQDVLKGGPGQLGDHECEGPALCLVCRGAAVAADDAITKAMQGADVLGARVEALRARLASTRAAAAPGTARPYLFRFK